MVYSTGRLRKGDKKEMNLGMFDISIVGCYGDVVVDGKLGRLGHILRESLDMG